MDWMCYRILDSRTPPPDYAASLTIPRYTQTLSPLLSLDASILVQILTHLSYQDLFYSVRPSCGQLSLVALTLLRKAYIPHYVAQVKPPYTTELLSPLPTFIPSSPSTSAAPSYNEKGILPPPLPVAPERREFHILSLYISACLYASRLSNESSLFLLPTDEVRRDLFEVYQPRARLEDLIVEHGWQRHLITYAPDWDDLRIRSKDVNVKWGMKTVGLLLPFRSQSGRGTVLKEVVNVERTRNESLEVTASKTLTSLERCRIRRFENDGLFWYEKESILPPISEEDLYKEARLLDISRTSHRRKNQSWMSRLLLCCTNPDMYT